MAKAKDFTGFDVSVTPRGVKRILSTAGIKVSGSDQNTALVKNASALKENIKTFIEEQVVAIFKVASKSTQEKSSTTEVKLKVVPQLHEIIDGLTSTKTYAVIARRQSSKDPSFLAVRDFGSSFNVKFYPSFSGAGFSEQELSKLAKPNSRVSRGNYQRMYFDGKSLSKVLETLPKGYEATTVENASLVLSGQAPKKVPRTPSKAMPVPSVKGTKAAATIQ